MLAIPNSAPAHSWPFSHALKNIEEFVQRIASLCFTCLADSYRYCTRSLRIFIEPTKLKIGYINKEVDKPRILITGLNEPFQVINALKKYTEQDVRWININELKNEAQKLKRDKDLLLVVFYREVGVNTPIRAFVHFDGVLHSYAETVKSFSKRGGILLIDPKDSQLEKDIQEQAKSQVPELKMDATISRNLWTLATRIQALFQS